MIDVGEAPLGELGHHVDLAHRGVVMQSERLVVGLLEPARVAIQDDGHGRAEHGESAVEPDDLLLVQP